MSQKVFDADTKYVDRFIKEYSKEHDFIDYKYYEAKIHPKYSDHVVVLSKNVFPKDAKLTVFDYYDNMYDVENLYRYDAKTFDELCVLKEKDAEDNEKQEVSFEVSEHSGESDSEGDISSTQFINETKIGMLGRLKHSSHNSQVDEEEYEGGEGDEEDNQSSSIKNHSNDLNNIKSDCGLNDQDKLKIEPNDEILDNQLITTSKNIQDKIDFTPKEESKFQSSKSISNSHILKLRVSHNYSFI